MEKVLIVDDTKNIRTLLTTCLELEGFEVETAIDGPGAMALLASHPFDLVFLDIKLPVMSGTEVLRQIRASGIDVPVIIMTAFGTVKNAVECTKMGAVAYLQKPFTAEKIRNVLSEIKQPMDAVREDYDDYVHQGKIWLEKGEPDKAFLWLKKALASNPARKEVYTLLAQTYQTMGNLEEATRFASIAAQFPD